MANKNQKNNQKENSTLKPSVFFNDTYTACGYEFDTTRKSSWIAASMREHPINGVQLVDPSASAARAEQLVRVIHDHEYVDAVRTGTPAGLASSQGFDWDEAIYTTAIAHSSGLVAATERVLLHGDPWAGTLSSGLHHASFSSGRGYCTFNGLSVAAQHAEHLGAERILVIDFDAHCGGGTYATTRHLPVVQIDVSTVSYDTWHPTRDDSASELIHAQIDNYLDCVRRALERADQHGPWDLVLYNAGMDPYDSGISTSVLRTREQLVAQWTTAPTVVTLAGGYTGRFSEAELVSAHRSTFEAFAQHVIRIEQ